MRMTKPSGLFLAASISFTINPLGWSDERPAEPLERVIEIPADTQDTLWVQSVLPESGWELQPIAKNSAPPDCSRAEASLTTLWPPNGRMKKVRITGVRDPDSGLGGFTLKITGVEQDEPVTGLHSKDTGPDARILPLEGRRKQRVELRAERDDNGNGRVYRVYFNADDGLNSCSGSVKVAVPKRRQGVARSDETSFDSTRSGLR